MNRVLKNIGLVLLGLLPLLSAQALADAVLVLGGTRNTGFEVVKLLKEQGHDVWSLARETSDTSKLDGIDVPTVTGDLLDEARMQAIFQEHAFDTVISTFGSSFKTKVKPDFTGNKYAIDGAKAGGVKKYVLITMVGIDETRDALEPRFQKLFTEQIDMKGRAEKYLRDSGLEYTIYRAGGLYNGLATGKAALTKDPLTMGVIARRELARIVVAGLDDPALTNETYTTVDPSVEPGYWDGKSEKANIPEELDESELD